MFSLISVGRERMWHFPKAGTETMLGLKTGSSRCDILSLDDWSTGSLLRIETSGCSVSWR